MNANQYIDIGTSRIVFEQGLLVGILPLDSKSMTMGFFQNFLNIPKHGNNYGIRVTKMYLD